MLMITYQSKIPGKRIQIVDVQEMGPPKIFAHAVDVPANSVVAGSAAPLQKQSRPHGQDDHVRRGNAPPAVEIEQSPVNFAVVLGHTL